MEFIISHFRININLKAFLKNHFCYCVTYATDDLFEIEEFKKSYDFAMHSKDPIDLTLLESMIEKLEQKKPTNPNDDEDKKIYFNKYSLYSRLTLHSNCLITELGETGIGLTFPFVMSNFCAFELTSQI